MAVVLIVSEDNIETSYTLSHAPIIAGRASHCTIKLTSDQCSSEHCQIGLNKNDQAFIMDLGSTNGIALNGSKTQNCKLFIGDELYIGEARAWLDEKKMTGVEKVTHTKEGAHNKIRPPKLEIRLPKTSSGKTGKLLSSASSKADRTSTAVRAVRKARTASKKNKG